MSGACSTQDADKNLVPCFEKKGVMSGVAVK